MLTDENLLREVPHSLGGVQRIYRYRDDHGLSLVNSPELHSFPFAWEAAVLKFKGDDFTLVYDTPLTDDVAVFANEDLVNAFISQAKELFGR